MPSSEGDLRIPENAAPRRAQRGRQAKAQTHRGKRQRQVGSKGRELVWAQTHQLQAKDHRGSQR